VEEEEEREVEEEEEEEVCRRLLVLLVLLFRRLLLFLLFPFDSLFSFPFETVSHCSDAVCVFLVAPGSFHHKVIFAVIRSRSPPQA
jgi:hypothetical protein